MLLVDKLIHPRDKLVGVPQRGVLAACLFLLAALCVAPPASAADGTVEISGLTTISEPGSYVVTRDVTVLGGEAITVEANDVSIDLNGHNVSGGVLWSTHNGAIYQDPQYRGLTVRNGGLWGGWGPGLAAGADARVESVTVTGSQGGGMLLGDNAHVYRCTVYSNTLVHPADTLLEVGRRSRVTECVISHNASPGALRAVAAGADSRIESCTAAHNTAGNTIRVIGTGDGTAVRSCVVHSNSGATAPSYAIGVGDEANVARCIVTDNGVSSAGPMYGIYASTRSRVAQCVVQGTSAASGYAWGYFLAGHGIIEECTARETTASSGVGFYGVTNVCFSSCTASQNDHAGFEGMDGCVFRHCVAKYNEENGFILGRWCSITHCVSDNNDGDATDAGIQVVGTNNRVENNHVSDSGRGIVVDGTGNFIAGNSCGYNGSGNYVIMPGNSSGAISTAPGAGFTMGSPWQNFQHH